MDFENAIKYVVQVNGKMVGTEIFPEGLTDSQVLELLPSTRVSYILEAAGVDPRKVKKYIVVKNSAGAIINAVISQPGIVPSIIELINGGELKEYLFYGQSKLGKDELFFVNEIGYGKVQLVTINGYMETQYRTDFQSLVDSGSFKTVTKDEVFEHLLLCTNQITLQLIIKCIQ